MAVYEFVCKQKYCDNKDKIVEIWKPIKRATDKELCPECGIFMSKLISKNNFVLKGTGWYGRD